MNKIFKVIWNHSTQNFVVVSELTKSQGKSSSVADNRAEPSKALLALGLAGAALLGSPAAMAATTAEAVEVPDVVGNTQTIYVVGDANGVAYGETTSVEGRRSTAIGYTAKALGVNSTALGSLAMARSQDSTAVGKGADATGNGSVALGNNAVVNKNDKSGKVAGIAIGQNSNVSGNMSIAMGLNAKANADNTIAIGTNATFGTCSSVAANSISIGLNAKSTEVGSVAIGANSSSGAFDLVGLPGSGHFWYYNPYNAQTYEGDIKDNRVKDKTGQRLVTSTVAIGRDSWANASSIAIGSNAIAAIGTGSTNGPQRALSIAVGPNAYATSGGTAIGGSTYANGYNTVAIGRQAAAVGDGSSAYGVSAAAVGSYSIAMGQSATTFGKGALAIGNTHSHENYNTDDNTVAFGTDSIAMGTHARSGATNATAVGMRAIATGNNSVAMGRGALVGETGLLATYNKASYNLNEAQGYVGYLDNLAAAGNTTVKSSQLYTDAVANVTKLQNELATAKAALEAAQSKTADSVALGSNAVTTSISGTALGAAANVSGNQAIALGGVLEGTTNATRASANNTIAIGAASDKSSRGTIATAVNAISMGTDAQASGVDSLAIGTNATASGNQSIAVGVGNVVSGNNSGAFGDPSYVTGNGSYSVGNNNTITTDNTFVFGSGINRAADLTTNLSGTIANSVYLGKDSEATAGTGVGTKALKSDQTAGTTTTAGDKGTVTDAKVGEITYGGFAGAAADGVVTIGASGSERRLQNLAAGEISNTSTDAINGSQLYAVAAKIGKEVFSSTYFHTNNGTNAGTGDATTNLGNITDAAGATGLNSVTAGVNATAQGNMAIAIGNQSNAIEQNAIAIGNGTNAAGARSIAIGSRSQTIWNGDVLNGQNISDAIAIGESAIAKGLKAVTLGGSANATGTSAIAIGDSAVSNGNGTLAMGSAANVTGNGSTGIGYGSNVKADNSTGIGRDTQVTGNNSLAMGYAAKATNETTIAIGWDAQASGDNATAVGRLSKASGADAIAMGRGSNASNTNTMALGQGTFANAANATAIGGYYARAVGENSTALGSDAAAILAGSVALGNSSRADGPAVGTNSATVNGISYGGFAGTDPVSVVSVGNSQTKQTRQIQNVAAGRINATSTDAINGSQLYLTANSILDNSPFQYTDNTGNPVVNIGGKFYPAGTTVDAAGNPVTSNGAPATELPADNVVTKAKGDNPQQVTNVAGNLEGAKTGTTAPTTSATAPQNVDEIKNNAATVGDVLNAGWNLEVDGKAADFVTPYDTVNFVGKNGVTVTETADSTNAKTTIEIAVDAAQLITTTTLEISDGTKTNPNETTPVANGKVLTPSEPTKLVTAGDIANAINNSGWTVASDTATNKSDELVKAGDKVNFEVGNNLLLAQDGKKFTYSLNPVLKGLTSAEFKDGDKVTNVTAGGLTTTDGTNTTSISPTEIKVGDTAAADDKPVTITSGQNGGTISNLDGNLDGSKSGTTAPTSNATKPTTLTESNAATVGDVLNAGWNLQGNGQAVDFVKPYDTVNFADGVGTKVRTSTDNQTSNVYVDVDTADITAAKGNDEGKVTGPSTSTPAEIQKLKDDLAAAEKALKDLPTTASDADKQAAQKAVDDAKKAIDDAGLNKIATAQNVADMINASGWKVTSGKEGTGTKATGDKETVELINPGETVKFIAGDNMVLKQDGNNFTYSVSPTPNFTSVNVTNALPTDNKNVGEKDAKQPTTLLNVSKAAADTPDAVVTAKDLANYGWVVATPDNGYDAAVKSQNVVNFIGDNHISVTGENNATTGTYDVKIQLADAGELSNIVEDSTKPTETETGAIQAGDSDGNNKTGFVSAKTVADAINSAGWRLQENGSQKDIVKPADKVNFVNGVGTTVNITTSADGVTSVVKVDTLLTPTNAAGDTLVKGNDGKWYKPSDVTNGVPNVGAVEQTPAGVNLINPVDNSTTNPTQLSNVAAGANTYAGNKDVTKVGDKYYNSSDIDPTTGKPKDGVQPVAAPTTTSALDGLANLEASNPTNVMTVADAKNLGWVVSAEGNNYTDDVRNANEVKFIGTGLATVTGETKDNVRTITVDVNAQKVVEAAQNPVVYTNAEGDKLVKGEDGKFYKPEDIKDAKYDPNTDQYTKADGTVVNPADNVIASMNDGNDSTTAPMTLSNVGGNLAPTYNKGDNEVKDGKPTDTAVTAPTKSQDAPKAEDVKKMYNNAATVGDVLNAGWNLQGNGVAKDFVKPYDTVNFVDGTGTKVEVNTDADGKVSTVKVNVDTVDLTNNPNGTVVNPTEAEEKALKEAKDALANLPGTATPEEQKAAQDKVDAAQKALDNAGNKIATAADVANAINNSGWNVTSAVATGSTGTVTGTTDELINPGEQVTFKAGNNMVLKQEGNNFTYSVSENPVFNTVTVGNEYQDADGKAVNKVGDKYYYTDGTEVPADKVAGVTKAPSTKLDAEKAIAADNNQDGKAPTTALNMTSTDGNPTQITGVGSVLNTTNVATNPDGDKATAPVDSKLVNLDPKDLTEGQLNSAATVRDIANMGWIVSASGNEYVDTVKNANKVDFVGTGLATVTGETKDGVRTITVDVNAQKVVEAAQNPVVYTNEAGDKLVKGEDGKFYKPEDIKDAKYDPNTDQYTKADGSVVNPADNVIASMNDGNDSTTTPMTLSNVGGNLAPTYNKGDNEVKDGKPTDTAVTSPTTSQDAPTADDVKKMYNNAATVGDVLNAGWNLQGNGVAKDFVKPYDTVNFVDGTGTKVEVNTDADGKVSTVKVNVDTVDLTNNPNGTVVTPAESLQAALDAAKAELDKLKADNAPEADVKAAEAKVADAQTALNNAGNKIATAADVANAINNSGFTLKADKTEGDNLTDTALANGELINPGDTVTMQAGKNMTVKQEADGKITYATKDDVEFNSVQIGNTAKVDKDGNPVVQGKDGNYYPAGTEMDPITGNPKDPAVQPIASTDVKDAPAVKLTADKGVETKHTDVDGNVTPTEAPTALSVKDTAGKDSQITGVASGLDTKDVPTNPNGSKGSEKLLDLTNAPDNVAVTSGDLKNFGWVVSAEGNDYKDAVKNANEVKFIGDNGISVTGETKNGVREITIKMEDGEVIKSNEGSVDGKPVVVVDGKVYNKDDIDPTTGKPLAGKDPIKDSTDPTKDLSPDQVVNKGKNFVTGNTVAQAIQESGFTVGKETDTSNVTFDNADEKVNPNDELKFADGKGTVVSTGTVKQIDPNGEVSTKTVVKVDVDTAKLENNANGSVKDPLQAAKDAVKVAEAALAKNPIDSALQKALADAKAEEAKAGNKIATAADVANAINNSGFTLKSSAVDSGEKVSGADELINPGDTVEMIAGKNMTVKQEADGKITYATKDDVEFNSIKLGDNGPTINNKEGNVNVNGSKITGVADGDISPNSTDVVNGSQIFALTGGSTTNVTNITVKNPDGSETTYENVVVDKDGKPALITYNVDGRGEYITNSVISAVNNMNRQGIKFFHTNDGTNRDVSMDQQYNGIDSRARGAGSTAVGVRAFAEGDNSVAFGNTAEARGEQSIAIGHNANASGSQSIAIGTGNIVEANHSGAFGDPNYVMGQDVNNAAVSGSYAIGNDNVINSSDTFVLGNNVNNAGTLDANGKPQAVANTVENSVYLGNKTTATGGDGSATGTLRNKKHDGTNGNTTTAGSTGTVSTATVGNMTYGGFAGAKANGVVSVGAAGSERRIQNVAAGEISATSTDAINGSQLYSVADNFNAKLGDVHNKINRNNKDLRAGIAGANAAAGLPQVYIPGKSMVAAAAGTFKGQSALAVGYSRASDNGKLILKLQGNANTRGDLGGSVGVGYQW